MILKKTWIYSVCLTITIIPQNSWLLYSSTARNGFLDNWAPASAVSAMPSQETGGRTPGNGQETRGPTWWGLGRIAAEERGAWQCCRTGWIKN